MSTKQKTPRRAGAGHTEITANLRVPRALGILVLLFTSIRCIALFTPPDWRLWGIDYPVFLPSRVLTIVMILLPLLVLIPRVTAVLARLIDSPVRASTRSSGFVFLAIAAVVLPLTLLWPVAYPFLGDGALYITEIYRSSLNGMGPSSLVKPSAWLSGHVVLLVAHLLDPEQLSLPYRYVASFALVLTVAALWFFLKGEPRRVIVLYSTAVLVTPVALLFFGYVELYVLPYTLCVMFFLALRSVHRGRLHVLIPGAILALGIAAGASMALFVPVYLLILLEHTSFLADLRRRKHAAITMEVLLFGAALFLVFFTPRTPVLHPYVLAFSSMVPAYSASPVVSMSYSFMDWNHILDVSNVLFFLLGPVVVLGLARHLLMRKSAEVDIQTTYHPRVLITSSFLFLYFANAVFGWARDWDMAIIPVTGIVFVWAWSMEWTFVRDTKRLTIFSVVFAALAVSITLPWIVLNADAWASAARFERIITNDTGFVSPHATYNGLENLRKFYTRERDGKRALATVQLMIQNRWESGIAYRHAFPLLDEMPPGAAKDSAFEWMFAQLSRERPSPATRHAGEFGEREYKEIATRMLLLAVGEGKAELAKMWATRLRKIIPAWKEEGFYRVFSDQNLPAVDRAAIIRSSMDGRTADPVLLDLAGQVFEMNSESQHAADVYAQALRADPVSIPALYLSLARVFDTQLSRPGSADSVLSLCVSRCANTREAVEARRLLGR